jgi:hypothetical protein
VQEAFVYASATASKPTNTHSGALLTQSSCVVLHVPCFSAVSQPTMKAPIPPAIQPSGPVAAATPMKTPAAASPPLALARFMHESRALSQAFMCLSLASVTATTRFVCSRVDTQYLATSFACQGDSSDVRGLGRSSLNTLLLGGLSPLWNRLSGLGRIPPRTPAERRPDGSSSARSPVAGLFIQSFLGRPCLAGGELAESRSLQLPEPLQRLWDVDSLEPSRTPRRCDASMAAASGSYSDHSNREPSDEKTTNSGDFSLGTSK